MRLPVMMAGSALLASLAAAAASSPPVKEIRFALVDHRQEGSRYYFEAAQRFKKELEERTKGRLHVTLVDVKVGKTKAAVDKLAAGEFEMANLRADTELARLEPRLSVFDVPYLIENYAHAARVIEGPLGARLIERLPEHGVTSLAYTYSGGFRIVAGRRAVSPEALRGMRVIVDKEVPLEAAQFEAWGARPLVVYKSDFIGTLKGGEAEAVHTTWNCYEGLRGMKAALPVISELGDSFFVTLVLANNRFLESLAEEDRTLLAAIAKETAVYERKITIRGNDEVKERHLRSGGRVVVLPPEERRALARASQPVRESYAALIGRDIVEAVQAEARLTARSTKY